MNFTEILKHWYSVKKRNLPWRLTKNPYLVWLSEIILQQTQVNQGLPYYKKFTTKYPTVYDLANAKEQEVLKLWQGLGYYSRARNLHFTAKNIVENLNGEFPIDYQDLIKLKGIGDYTASAIASICNNEPCAVLDGNVFRVLSRYFGINTPINSSEGKKEFKALAQSLIPLSDIGDYNQAIMEFGAKQCKPKSPNCTVCPLNNSCKALQTKKVAYLPIKLKKLKVRVRYINFLVFISNDKKTILEKREGKGIWQGLFQFPFLETKKSYKEKEISRLLEFNYKEFTLYNTKDIVHKLSHQHLHSKFWIIYVDDLDNKGIDFSEIRNYPVPILISNFIENFNF